MPVTIRGTMMAERTAPAPAREGEALRLQRFLPYRLAVLAERVSHALAQIYAGRFDLSRPEWRVLASLAECGPMAAKDVSAHSTMDKMTVSRAVAALEEKGHLTRQDDPRDRRNRILRMTPSGRALYEKVVPLALAREDYLLEALSAEDRAALDRILDTLLTRAAELERRG